MILIGVISVAVIVIILYFVYLYNRLYILMNSASVTLGQVRVARSFDLVDIIDR